MPGMQRLHAVGPFLMHQVIGKTHQRVPTQVRLEAVISVGGRVELPCHRDLEQLLSDNSCYEDISVSTETHVLQKHTSILCLDEDIHGLKVDGCFDREMLKLLHALQDVSLIHLK